MNKPIVVFWLIPLVLFAGGNFTLENDISNSDRHYTHGTRISQRIDKYFDWNTDFFKRDNSLSFGIGQYLYTPSDISIEELMEDDRPYCGWLYGELLLESIRGKNADLFALNLGVIGPSAFGEQTQKTVHKIIDSVEPQGWDNQLEDEVGVNLIYQRKYKYRHDGFIDFDIISHGGGCLGNIFTYANLGVLFRTGYNLPHDFGSVGIEPTIRASKKFGIYTFVGTDGRYVVRNIFLDGNTFKDSHSIEKEPLVGDIKMGIGGYFKKVGIIYSYNIRSKEFERQKEHNEFGTITVVWGL